MQTYDVWIVTGIGSKGNPYGRAILADDPSSRTTMERIKDQACQLKSEAHDKQESLNLICLEIKGMSSKGLVTFKNTY